MPDERQWAQFGKAATFFIGLACVIIAVVDVQNKTGIVFRGWMVLYGLYSMVVAAQHR